MSRNTTAKGSLRASASLTRSTAASAPSQNTGSKPAARAGERARAAVGGVLLVEQAAAQLAKADHLLGDLVLEEDLPIGVANLGLVVDHEHPDVVGLHAIQPWRTSGCSGEESVSRPASGTIRCSDAPRPGPSLAAQMRPPSALTALAHQCRPMPWLVSGDLVEKPFSNTRSRFCGGDADAVVACTAGAAAVRRARARSRR